MATVISVLSDKAPSSYLSRLRIPTNMSTAKSLSMQEWLALVGTAGTLSLVALWTYWKFTGKSSSFGRVNPNIQKESPKVVHGFDIEDLGDNVAFCRCWRSAKFPYCDGSHTEHNRLTGDNVGPVCLKRKAKK